MRLDVFPVAEVNGFQQEWIGFLGTNGLLLDWIFNSAKMPVKKIVFGRSLKESFVGLLLSLNRKDFQSR